MRRILCLYLPNWPIQSAFGGLAARNSSSPVLLHSRDPRRGDLVVACNAAAVDRGVRLQMPLAEAAALAQRHGKCLIFPHDPAADLAALATLAQHCERFSPIIGWKTVQARPTTDLGPWTLDFGPSPGPDCLFLDVTGIGVLFGGEEKLARAVITDIAQQGYESRVAITDSIGSGWAAATQSDSPQTQVLSTEYVVLSTESCLSLRTPHSAFRTLPPESLRLPPETLDLLAQLGITQLDQLLALPRESLRARFGEQLLLRIDQLSGAAQETIVPHRPPPQFIEEQVLEFPAERQEAIEQILRQLVRQIATALANRREGVLKLICRLDCAPGRPTFLEVGLFRPSADHQHLCDLLRMQLEQAPLPGPLGRIRLEAALTAPLENRQGELFAGNQHEASRQFALLIDRASSRLGPNAVLRPQLTADPLPEKAIRWVAGVGKARKGRAAKHSVLSTQYSVRGKQKKTWNLEPETCNSSHSALRTPHSALLRPLFLHSPPLPLDVLSISPDGPPISFRFQGQSHQIAASSGPERIETGWWRGKSIRRDYWRIETTTGHRFWLFRSLDDRTWHLHGEYA
jgi:protein ImuB